MIQQYLLIYLFALLFTFLLTVAIEHKLIPKLRSRAAQPIYADGPSWHMSKSGTPTMGGIAFVISVSSALLVGVIFFAVYGMSKIAASIAIALLFSLGNAAVGFFDDITKLKRQRNGGLTPKQKIFLQLILAVLFLYARAAFVGDDTALLFSFGELELGLLYYPFAVVMLLGIVNCANLTDGVDGLAASVAFAIGASVILLSANVYADSTLLAICMCGAAMGFLCFNLHPARVFMGDTGSLFLGALAISCGFSMQNPASMITTGAVYVIEGVSVILQVTVFKLCKKRLFKMAPLHHHLEKSGMEETGICIAAMIITLAISILTAPLYVAR